MLKITDSGLKKMVGTENVTLELTPRLVEVIGQVVEERGRLCVCDGTGYFPIENGMIIRRNHYHLINGKENLRYPSSVRSYVVSKR